MFFPPEIGGAKDEPSTGDVDAVEQMKAREDAEAKAVADELPSVPTGALADNGHQNKKQKQGNV
jgi:hypothetical protein